MNKVAAFALRRKNSILSMSEKMFCPPQPLRFWITPAYAGKRRSDWIIRLIYWDHPRVCGEKAGLVFQLACPLGSPPRMRGKAAAAQVKPAASGITPAHAGKRWYTWCAKRLPPDHPRVCGEKVTMSDACSKSMGSPPRMRGKESGSIILKVISGITPAYAGKSRSLSWTSSTA